jgi:hypothetical protein
MLTFEWEDDVWKNFFDFSFTTQDHSDTALFSQKFVWLGPFPQTLQEDREIVLVSELFWLQPPFHGSDSSIEVHTDWKITSVIMFFENCLFFGSKKVRITDASFEWIIRVVKQMYLAQNHH